MSEELYNKSIITFFDPVVYMSDFLYENCLVQMVQ